MSKTLRIVAKDIRHLWPEIALSLALTIGFAATDHFIWPQYRFGAFREADTLRTWMAVFMVISWWLLVSRAVHDESLVGDRQFWITRPYGWRRVLAAKLIFITLFILVPYLLAQCALLLEAGLNPLSVLPGLALTLGVVFALFLLPLIALSAVTATITRMFIIFFALCVYTGLVAYLSSVFGKDVPWMPGHPPPYLAIVVVLVPIVSAIVTWLQYARRRTALSITLLVALVLVFTAGGLVTFYAPNSLSDFPTVVAGETPPLQVALDPDPKLQFSLDDYKARQSSSQHTNEQHAQIPVLISGIASGHVINIDAQTLTLSADGVDTSTISWQHAGGGFGFMSSSPGRFITGSKRNVDISPSDYKDFAGKMVTIHLTYAVTELEAESPIDVVFNGHTADLPQNGHCVKDPTDLTSDSVSTISCQYALTGPSLTRVTYSMSTSCAAAPQPPTTMSVEEWIGSTDRSLRNVDISPVVSSHNFDIKKIEHPSSRVFTLCPGSHLTFTKYHIVRKRRIEVTLPPLDLRLYIPPPPPERRIDPNTPDPTEE